MGSLRSPRGVGWCNIGWFSLCLSFGAGCLRRCGFVASCFLGARPPVLFLAILVVFRGAFVCTVVLTKTEVVPTNCTSY